MCVCACVCVCVCVWEREDCLTAGMPVLVRYLAKE